VPCPGSLLLLAACALASACEASPPTAPAATLDRIVVLYSGPTRPGEIFSARAYAVDSDGAYTDVSSQSQWTSSNPLIVTVDPTAFAGATARPMGAGTAIITATYQGVSGHLPVRVPARPDPPFGPLSLSIEIKILSGPGQELRLTAVFSPSMDVTSAADWTSSEPSVATVNQGLVRSQRIGNTEITATYGGSSASYLIPVHPGLLRP